MQNRLYSNYQPFFASCSYYAQLYFVMQTGKQRGCLEAVNASFNADATVFLPFLAAVLLSPLVEINRNINVWIQVIELA